MQMLRRVLVGGALMFWQGGFTFYAGVVVPVGQDVVGSHRQRGFITRRVAPFPNLAGPGGLRPRAWAAAASRATSARRYRLRWLAFAGLVISLGLLAWLLPRLDELLDPDAGRVLDRSSFGTGHRLYLLVSTAQW